jgi:hypothetical protein
MRLAGYAILGRRGVDPLKQIAKVSGEALEKRISGSNSVCVKMLNLRGVIVEFAKAHVSQNKVVIVQVML